VSWHASTIVLANGLLQGARPDCELAAPPFASPPTDLDLVVGVVTQLR